MPSKFITCELVLDEKTVILLGKHKEVSNVPMSLIASLIVDRYAEEYVKSFGPNLNQSKKEVKTENG